MRKIYNKIVIKILEPHQFLTTCSTLLNITLKLNEERPDVISGLSSVFSAGLTERGPQLPASMAGPARIILFHVSTFVSCHGTLTDVER